LPEVLGEALDAVGTVGHQPRDRGGWARVTPHLVQVGLQPLRWVLGELPELFVHSGRCIFGTEEERAGEAPVRRYRRAERLGVESGYHVLTRLEPTSMRFVDASRTCHAERFSCFEQGRVRETEVLQARAVQT
jgi:hypothetical protein